MEHSKTKLSPGELHARQEAMITAATKDFERGKDFKLPIVLDLPLLQILVAQLQLASRHPTNNGPAAQGARDIIDQIIARVELEGFLAIGEMMRAGDDAEL